MLNEMLLVATVSSSKLLNSQRQQDSKYISDETTLMVCKDLQVTPTQVSNGEKQIKIACVDICALQDQIFCILKDDSNVYSLSPSLSLTRLPY